MSQDDSNTVPASADAYRPVVAGFEQAKVDTRHPGYRSAAQAAHEAGLTQAQFSKLLAHEARRVQAAQAQQKPAAPAKPYKSMSFHEKLVRGGHA